MKLTFKKQSWSSGLASIGAGTPDTDILLDSQEVGTICVNDGAYWSKKWKYGAVWIRFQAPKTPEELAAEPNCPWRWKRIVAIFDTINAAKEYLRRNKELFEKLVYLPGPSPKLTVVENEKNN